MNKNSLSLEGNFRIKAVFGLFSLSIWLVLYFGLQFGDASCIGQISTVLLIIQALWLVIRSFVKKNILYVIFFCFISLYTFPSKLFFFDEIYLSVYNQCYTYTTAVYTTLIFSLFLITINLFIKIPFPKEMKRIEFKENSIIFIALYAVTFVIVLISKRTGSLYDGSGGEVEVSSLNEYVIILFLILHIYSGGKAYKLFLLNILYILYALFAIITGGRIEVVLLLLLLLNIRFQYVIPFKKMILFFILGVWMMSIFGTIRHNPQILLSGNITNIINPIGPKEYVLNSQGSNEGDVYWASERLLILMDKGELTMADRVKAGMNYLLSSFVPVSWLSPLANLSNYKTKIENTGGGGLAPIFFYVMFGLGGVAFLGYFVAVMLNSLAKSISNLKLIYVILMITMLARWFAYYPIPLIKLCLWGVLAYYLINCLDYTMKKFVK